MSAYSGSQTASVGSKRSQGSLRSMASVRSRATTCETKELKKDDLLFIMSWRGKKARSDAKKADLANEIGVITQSEYDELQFFKTECAEFTESLRKDGWFRKTPKAVEHYIDGFLKEHSLHSVVYNQLSATYTPAVEITRMLRFYHRKGIQITLRSVSLTDEQQEVCNLPEEGSSITAVNSGAGTGKTETVINLANNLIDEGVIFVAFTNSAVDHAVRRLKDIVVDIDEVDKKFRRPKGINSDEPMRPPKILICTIDFLVGSVLSKRVSVDGTGGEFESLVCEAIAELPKHKRFFHKTDGSNIWNHIIVDEGQDMSANRFKFLTEVFTQMLNSREEDEEGSDKYAPRRTSMTIVGDPRQRLDTKGGQEFEDLLHTENYRGIPVRKLAFTKSFRFENTKLIQVANALSSLRPHIDVPLVPFSEPIVDKAIKVFSSPEDVAETIILLVKQRGVKCEQICMLRPAPNKACKSTLDGDEVRSILTNQSISCSQEGEWKEGLVFLGSIHSAKGLEFDYVFFLGAAGFPEGFAKTIETNEAISLNFVANTRARKELFYLSNDTFAVPRGVPKEFTENGTTARRFQIQHKPRAAVRSDEIEEANYRAFEEANSFSTVGENGFQLFTGQTKKIDPQSKSFLYETISAILAVVKGKTIVQKASKCVLFRTDVFKEKTFSTICYDLTTSSGYLEVRPEANVKETDGELFASLRKRYPVEDIKSHQDFHLLLKGAPSQLTDMRTINNNVMTLASLLECDDDDPENNCYQTVVCSQVRASAIISDKVVLVFSPSLHLASLVKKLSPSRKVFSIGLQSGNIIEITQAPYQVFRYANYLQTLFTISIHLQVVREKQASSPFTRPTFLVDTEFETIATGKAKTIYDIAIVNGKNPFASIATLVDCGRDVYNRTQIRNRKPWEYDDFKGSPTIEQVANKFCAQLAKELSSGNSETKPVMFYYNAVHDVSFLVGDKVDPNIDYGIELVETFRKPPFNGVGSLDVNYDKITMSNHNDYKAHIIRHTAIGDTMLFYEMMRRVHHPIGE